MGKLLWKDKIQRPDILLFKNFSQSFASLHRPVTHSIVRIRIRLHLLEKTIEIKQICSP